ncbi:hypothetical protein DJ021_05800 [Phenylobacterium hankyongense]|uniref:HTH iclR-type domain-containing protein n=1 Tax=Phenylobacterium hankyongense TaxID=1813876 RepID=A0A328B0G6_9CAUL|nr:hypothetical protein [Phenylobacterium hankyongense]RAK59354.1 hypothetical protein DJ021_05800 [Phenylobacterium hankyongense]
MEHELKHLVARRYPAIATDLLSPLLKLLSVSRQYCGDVDTFLVVLVVAIQTTRHGGFAARTPEQLLSGEMPVFPGLGTNGRSIAESLGIPKETVRRKVAELIEMGWFARRDGKLYFTAEAYRQLAPVRDQLETLAVRYYKTVAALREAPTEQAS